MKYKFVLFDLDGTLTDPQEGICNCINYAASFYGVQKPHSQLTKYIGPPLLKSFAELVGEENAKDAIVKYRERFSTIGLYENEIYPNVKNTLALLKDKGYVLCTASSKPQVYVEKILQHFDIAQYFTVIGGATLDGKIGEKEQVIELVLGRLNADKRDVVMVGDTRFDLIGAEKMGLDAIGVTYGFAAAEELVQYPHIALIDDISEITEILKV
ncbi:MAG: HAD hydrolase-like protein [Oscillospiraceae bacterium]|nr:HAD hydrolase-like protein [Oscillospiraceae bacterium]